MYGILMDVTRCTGCDRCVEACGLAHAPADAVFEPYGDELSADQLLSLEVLGSGHYARKSCMHCLEPSCVSACLVGGITKSPDGPVVYDPDKCIGCRYCMLACPHHVPRYEWSKRTPFMKKCDMCADHLAAGLRPECVDACPNQALHFGRRDELLDVAHQAIAERPERYIHRVWGEHEWGGTSVMYISDVDLSALDWPAPTTPPIPALTDPMIEKTPVIGASVGIGLWALSTIIKRRNKVMAAEQRRNEEERTND